MDALVLPLLVGIQIRFGLVTVERDLVVHAVRDGRAEQGFLVLQSLAVPDDEHVIRGDVPVLIGLVRPSVVILDDLFLAELDIILCFP